MTKDQAEAMTAALAAFEYWLIGVCRAVIEPNNLQETRRELLVDAIDDLISAMETEGKR